MTTLETRYRRLLALYPAEHRRAFGDEMLGVLMSSAGEGQQRPRLGESTNLMWHALWRRLGGLRQAHPYGHWSRAAAVVGVIGPLALFAAHIRQAVGDEMWAWHVHHHPVSGLAEDWAPGVAAALLALAVLFGPRWLAVSGAWLLAAGEVGARIGFSALPFGDNLSPATMAPMVLSLTTAVALSVPQPARGGMRLLGGRGVAALAAVALLAVSSTPIAVLLAWATPNSLFMENGRYLSLALISVPFVMGLVVLRRRLDAPVRRRVISILFPSGVLYLLAIALWPFIDVPVAWLSLVLIVLFLGLSVLAIKRWERLLHLAELGRRVEREAEPTTD